MEPTPDERGKAFEADLVQLLAQHYPHGMEYLIAVQDIRDGQANLMVSTSVEDEIVDYVLADIREAVGSIEAEVHDHVVVEHHEGHVHLDGSGGMNNGDVLPLTEEDLGGFGQALKEEAARQLGCDVSEITMTASLVKEG